MPPPGQGVTCRVVARNDGLRLKVYRGPEAAVHVERDGAVLVRDPPGAVALAIANGAAHPHVRVLSVRPLAADSVEAVAEGYSIAHGDAQVTDFIPNWTL